ncbi:MAG: hypothetical protein M1339_08230, partial [Bacteroidetes bacterium]|nr:hypothetical protein [Bacteroidota bacterium]
MLRKSFFIATVLLCGVVNAQPRAIPLKDSTSTSYMEGISSFNHVYVSLADLASALGLRTFMLGPTGKMSVYSGDGSMLFTPNSLLP